MMDGFRAYKYYAAIKLHFTNAKYDVFKTKGRVRCSQSTFESRNDRFLFERIGNKFSSDKDYIQYIASNFMYRNPNVIYSADQAESNYMLYLRRKQSITKVFTDDLMTMIECNAQYYDFCGSKIPDVIQLWMSDRITLETAVILNDMDGFTSKLNDNSHISLLLGEDLLRLEKSKQFVKYNPYKIMDQYQSFIEEIKGNKHGQDVQVPAEQVR